MKLWPVEHKMNTFSTYLSSKLDYPLIKKLERSVQLVRGSSFRNGLLQNPYFRRTVFSSPSVLSSFAWGIIGRFWHLKCEAPHFLRLQALMTRHWFYNIDQWLAHTVFSRRRSIFGFQFFFLPRIILTGKRHHLENRPMPRNKMNWHLALLDLPWPLPEEEWLWSFKLS